MHILQTGSEKLKRCFIGDFALNFCRQLLKIARSLEAVSDYTVEQLDLIVDKNMYPNSPTWFCYDNLCTDFGKLIPKQTIVQFHL